MLRRTQTPAVRRSWLGLIAVALAIPAAAAEPVRVLDAFEELSGWTATASPGARVEIAHDQGNPGMGMRIDFDLGSGGYVIVRKDFEKIPTLPNYAFNFSMRGDASPNNFEFKLVDEDGQNVWWYRQRGFTFPPEWRTVIIKKPRIEFAWGPAIGGPPQKLRFIEFAISAGTGGKGSIWIDDLRLAEREPPPRSPPKPEVSASTAEPEHGPELVLDQDVNTSWRSGRLAADQWMQIDFGKPREYGGLVIDWDPQDYATTYHIQTSNDGKEWTTAYHCAAGNGGRDYIYLPDAESRYVRIDLVQSNRGEGYGIRTVTVKPFEFSVSPNQFLQAVASEAPRGTFPKYFSNIQTYWTVVGVDGDDKEALLNEEGMLEVERGGFSLEPFVYVGGTLLTWNSVRTTQELAQDYLPIPSVVWHHEQLELRVTAFAAGRPGASTLYARYSLRNTAAVPQDMTLYVTIRPFQVLPPWQSLNIVGGVSVIRDLVFDARTVWVNGDRQVMSLTPPSGFGAATFEEGLVTDLLTKGRVPFRSQLTDPFGHLEGALEYSLRVEPGAQEDVYIAVPLHESEGAATGVGTEGAVAHVQEQLAATTRQWELTLNRVEFQVPPADVRIVQTLKSTLAYILINRDGPAIQPGSRNYARSWIRDGAFTSSSLLEMGFTEEVRDFIRWFAHYQLPDGRIPCCVDQRGADVVPEYDSDGEFVYTVAEYYRYTHDIGFVSEMWPAVLKAVGSIEALRSQRTTEEYATGSKRLFYGLLPESISHEGYSSRPVHSYWDDFFALRGLKDAVELAGAMGDDANLGRLTALRDDFQRDLYASITATMAERKIDYIPGSADLGDFDPSSTAVALTPGGELARLPEPALSVTFDKYYDIVRQRQTGERHPDAAYTPYELRNVGALVMMGRRDAALGLLEFLLAERRPPGWNEWQEIVWNDAAAPRFIGDMPHTWVGSSFIRAVRSMYAYERESDQSLVLAAGLPSSWVMSESGAGVKRLPTYYGILNFRIVADGANTMRARLSGDLALPPGGIVLQPPLPRPLTAVSVNGVASSAFTADTATISQFPADVVLTY